MDEYDPTKPSIIGYNTSKDNKPSGWEGIEKETEKNKKNNDKTNEMIFNLEKAVSKASNLKFQNSTPTTPTTTTRSSSTSSFPFSLPAERNRRFKTLLDLKTIPEEALERVAPEKRPIVPPFHGNKKKLKTYKLRKIHLQRFLALYLEESFTDKDLCVEQAVELEKNIYYNTSTESAYKSICIKLFKMLMKEDRPRYEEIKKEI